MTKGFEMNVVLCHLQEAVKKVEAKGKEWAYDYDYNTARDVSEELNKLINDEQIKKYMKTQYVTIHTTMGLYTIYLIGEDDTPLCSLTIDLDDLFGLSEEL